ncbi:MAG TPA: hydrogenase maturation nickel metallochaperone HypA [Dehalococcoidia bacterium]|nr:hydrogenase maturation nickel metallochaperone HypA [Dehalococcoidia bacterium]
MHELGITRNILEIALEQAGEADAHKINLIHVVAGELSGIEPDCISFYFNILKKDYSLGDAELSISKVPAKLKCRSCDTEFVSSEMPWSCPGCGSLNLEIVTGGECYVESIEVDA